MENKEIIVDGVDVSGCPFFEDERKLLNPAGQELNFKNICSLSFYNFTDFDKDFLCNQSPNCYYKQLKRKEQECEELKIEAEKWESAFTLDTKMLDTADRRKNELEQQLDQLKAENKHLNDLLNQALKELEQSREAIEKVREYSKCGWDMFMERNSYEDYEAMAEWMKNQFYFILQICDEVNDV